MKILKYIFPVVAVLAAASCSNDEYKPGEPDVEGSYDVSFAPEQSKTIEYGPKDKKFEYEITATRSNTDGAIEVPLTIKGDNKVIFATPLMFGDGESTAKFKVFFTDLEIQKPYEFVISIEDPKYALIYGFGETTVTLSVIKVDYAYAKRGVYSSPILGQPGSPAEFPVDLEYSAILGTYRVTNTWSGGGEPIVFQWDGQSEVVNMAADAMFATGLSARVDQAGNTAPIYAKILGAKYSKKDNTLIFMFDYSVPDVGGSIGQSQDTIKLQ